MILPYYIRVRSGEFPTGPFTKEEIVDKVRQGEFFPESTIWRKGEGEGKWTLMDFSAFREAMEIRFAGTLPKQDRLYRVRPSGQMSVIGPLSEEQVLGKMRADEFKLRDEIWPAGDSSKSASIEEHPAFVDAVARHVRSLQEAEIASTERQEQADSMRFRTRRRRGLFAATMWLVMSCIALLLCPEDVWLGALFSFSVIFIALLGIALLPQRAALAASDSTSKKLEVPRPTSRAAVRPAALSAVRQNAAAHASLMQGAAVVAFYQRRQILGEIRELKEEVSEVQDTISDASSEHDF
jgi:hypothetical protein